MSLRDRGFAYRVLGGTRFFAREEVADVMAWVRLVSNPADVAALARALGAPRRGVGEKGLEAVGALVAQADVLTSGMGGLLGALRQAGGRLGPKQALAVEAFADQLEAVAAAGGPEQVLAALLEEPVGFARWLADSQVDAGARLENLVALVGIAASCASVEELLERAALDGATEQPGREAVVSLATAHAMKGLEAERVVVVGMDEGTLPHWRACQAEAKAAERGLEEMAEDEVAEERRVAYVALSRAKDHLVLPRCLWRRAGGRVQDCEPSRFLEEAGVVCDFGLVGG